MPVTALDRPRTSRLSDYARLRDEVHKTLLLGQQRIEREKVLTYWKTGRLISGHIQGRTPAKRHADYGSEVIRRLSRDLGIGEQVLYRTVRFAQAFPNLSARTSLTWTHYRELLVVPDGRARLKLADEAGRKKWTTDQLIEKVREEIRESEGGVEAASQASSSKKAPPPFRPKRGLLRTHQILHLEHIGSKAEHQTSEAPLFIDLGFSTFISVPPSQAKGLEEGDRVQVEDSRRLTRLPKATKADLYTYRAAVERVIDADTLWVRIDLGFEIFLRQKLRLRGVDAPELDTAGGRAAKRFVESQLESVSEVVITTTKPDKFDRYLTDVWLGDTNLNQLLLTSGHARPPSEFSTAEWNELNWGRF